MALRRLVLTLALLATACSAQVSSGGARVGDVDAGTLDGGDGDAAPAGACNQRVLYLSFEGQTLTRGRSDATTNTAEWMTDTTGTAPPYHNGDADRATQIRDITDGVRARLAGFPITVVTTRPASGEYIMVVLGGRAGQVKSAFGGAVNRLDCDDSRHNDVAWIADSVAPTTHVINSVIGAVGFGLGLTATLKPSDCMCGWDNDCNADNASPCTLGTAIARDPAARQLCTGAAATQDEVATLRTAFCGKP